MKKFIHKLINGFSKKPVVDEFLDDSSDVVVLEQNPEEQAENIIDKVEPVVQEYDKQDDSNDETPVNDLAESVASADKEIKSDGILDNIPCMTMIECACSILEYFEEQERYGNTSTAEIYQYVEQLIFEYFVRIGGELINKDSEFQPLRHKLIDKRFINPKAPVEIVSPGVILNKKVLIKAKVKSV